MKFRGNRDINLIVLLLIVFLFVIAFAPLNFGLYYPVIFSFVFSATFFFILTKRKKEVDILNDLKEEINWEKKKVIRFYDDFSIVKFISKNIDSIFLSFLLFSFILFSFSYTFDKTENKMKYPEIKMKTIEPTENFSKNIENKESEIKIQYYSGDIPKEDLKRLLLIEKEKLEKVLGVSLGNVKIAFDYERTRCVNERTIACYLKGWIFIVPQGDKVTSELYYRKLIRHELIHHAEEIIAEKYESEDITFSS